MRQIYSVLLRQGLPFSSPWLGGSSQLLHSKGDHDALRNRPRDCIDRNLRTFVGDDEFVQPKRNETAPRSECRLTFKNTLTQPRLLEMDVKPATGTTGISSFRDGICSTSSSTWVPSAQRLVSPRYESSSGQGSVVVVLLLTLGTAQSIEERLSAWSRG